MRQKWHFLPLLKLVISQPKNNFFGVCKSLKPSSGNSLGPVRLFCCSPVLRFLGIKPNILLIYIVGIKVLVTFYIFLNIFIVQLFLRLMTTYSDFSLHIEVYSNISFIYLKMSYWKVNNRFVCFHNKILFSSSGVLFIFSFRLNPLLISPGLQQHV